MTKTEKIEFVKTLTGHIAAELIRKIDDETIPDDWDGIELREILAEKFASETYPALMKGKRKSEFKNVCLVKYI